MLSPVGKLIFQHFEEHPVAIVKRGFPVPEALIGQGTHIQALYTDNIIPIGYLG